MFDIKWIRDNADAFNEGLARRGLSPKSEELLALDEKRRALIAELQDVQTTRNAASKLIGKAKSTGDDEAAQKLIDEVASLKSKIQNGEEALRGLEITLTDAMSGIPNLPLGDVPMGKDETDNVHMRTVGDKREFDFEPKEHFDLGEALGLMSFDEAVKISGARFVVLKGALARLERALGAFMLDLHTSEFGLLEVQPPVLVRDDALFGTGQLPKFSEDLYKTTDGYWLIPTAEVPLTNLARESILEEAELPRRMAALTPCFRSEAGSAGRDTRGMIRQHQFSKVEMVSLTTPDTALDELERMTSCAEEVLKRLSLPYQVVLLSTGDMGFSARKTYDIEVWLPGQGQYREISSCSVCGDFQARRMDARYRTTDGGDVRHLHTLNGSGLAVGRTLVAVLENFQQADGSIIIPEALKPYMGGLSVISAAK